MEIIEFMQAKKQKEVEFKSYCQQYTFPKNKKYVKRTNLGNANKIVTNFEMLSVKLLMDKQNVILYTY